LINDRQVKRLQAYVRLAVKDGAKLLCGGEVVREGDCRRGFFYAPTVLGDVHPKMRVAQDEVAGPILDLLPVARVEQAVEAANRLPSGQRAVTVYTRDLGRALRVAAALRSQTVRVNGSPHEPAAHEWVLGAEGRRRSWLDRFSRWRSLSVHAAAAAAATEDGGPAGPERAQA
jgi:aldehyde dehydrogenase (NAD+)